MNSNDLRERAAKMLKLAHLLEQAGVMTEQAATVADELNGAQTAAPPLETPTATGTRRYVKFSPKDKAAFKRAWKAKVPVEQIMDQFGLTKSAVYSRALTLGLGRRFPLFAGRANGSGAHV